MKLKQLLTAAALASGFFLHAETIEIPVLYRNAETMQPPCTLQSFGLAETPERIIFAFQIKELPQFLKQEKASLSFYSDTDHNLETGRFPKVHGWDFQINVQLYRNTLHAIRWNGNNAQDLKLNGKYTVVADKDLLFLMIRKEGLPGIKFEKQFKFKVTMTAGNRACGGLQQNEPADKKQTSGVFPNKFQVPEGK